MTKGIIWGKFAPLTLGHMHLIQSALQQVDELVIVLCWDSKLRDPKPWVNRALSLNHRMQALESATSEMSNVMVTWIDESEFPPYPHGWNQFQEKIDHVLDLLDYEPDVFFSGDGDMYDREVRNRWGWHTEWFDRFVIPATATEIRRDPIANWQWIHPTAQKLMSYWVNITGVESTGKTTLVNQLERVLPCEIVDEFGRAYVENRMKRESELFTEDFVEIAEVQTAMIKDALGWILPIVITDTDAKSTVFFQRLYSGETSQEVLDVATDPNLQPDLNIQLMTDGAVWTTDGFREQNTTEDWQRSEELFDSVMCGLNCTVEKVDGDWGQRYHQSLNLIMRGIHEESSE